MSTRRLTAHGLALALLAVVAGALAVPEAAAEVSVKRGAVGGRAYRLYVPTRIAEPPRPLVVALHGCWQTPEDFVTTARLGEAAERRGLLVVAPAQGRQDNSSRCWNSFMQDTPARTGAEIAEIMNIAAEVRREYPAVGKGIIVIGFSAGGYMAVNLACVAPDVVIGVGVASGGPSRCGVGAVAAVSCMRGHGLDGNAAAAACRAAMGGKARPVRASLWHGAEDAVVSPANLKALGTMFAQLDGAGAPKTGPGGALVYHDARGRPMVQAWLIEGMGHAWSGGDERGTQAYPAGPSATEAMLDFLLSRE